MDGQMQNRQGDADVGIVPKRGDAAGDYVPRRPLREKVGRKHKGPSQSESLCTAQDTGGETSLGCAAADIQRDTVPRGAHQDDANEAD